MISHIIVEDDRMNNIQKLPKSKILEIIKEELGGVLAEAPQDVTTPEGVPAVPRGRVPTQKQSGIERGTAAMLNDLLSRVEELERADEETRRLLGQIIKKMGAKL
jgi:hypothetical protein